MPFINIPSSGSASWKDAVADPASLPASGNEVGDARVTESTSEIYVWDGSAWQNVGGSASAITALTNDVTATGPGSVAATVAFVGGETAADVATSVQDTQAATDLSTVSTIVKRDASGETSLDGLNLDGSVSGAINIKAADTTTGYTIKMPNAQGGATTYLENDGSGNLSWATVTAGIQSINSDTTLAQTIAGGTGISVATATGTTTITNTAPMASTGNLTEATSSVLTITGGTGAVIGSGTTVQVLQSGAAQDGYLSSTDWNTFNNKATYPTLGGNEDKVLATDGLATSWQYAGLGSGSFASGTVILGRPKPTSLTGADNIIIGSSAGNSLSNQTKHIAIGTSALSTFNVAVANEPNQCVAIGYEALKVINTASQNWGMVAMGYRAGYNATSGDGAVLIGFSAGNNGTSFGRCVYIGRQAGGGGSVNTGVGMASLRACTGSDNTALGDSSLSNVSTGSHNIGIGVNAGNSPTGGATITTGSSNVIIGHQAGVLTASTSSAIALGRLSVAGANEFSIGSDSYQINTMLLGRGGASQTVANAVKIQTMRGSGTDRNMSVGTLTIAGAQGTGTGAGGDVIIATAPPGASGSTLNAHVERMRVTDDGDVGINVVAPTKRFHVFDGSSQCVATFQSDTTGGGITLQDATTTSDTHVGIGANGDDLCFRSGGVVGANMTLDASGNLKVPNYIISPAHYDEGTETTNFTIDWANSPVQTVTLNGTTNATVTLSNPVQGGAYVLRIIQGATPGTIDFTAGGFADAVWPGGTAPTLSGTTGDVDIINLLYIDDGGGTVTYYGTFATDFS